MIKRLILFNAFFLQCIAAPGDPVTLKIDTLRSSRLNDIFTKFIIASTFTNETLIRNGDEELFEDDRRGNFGKSLEFDGTTFHKDGYDKLLLAIYSQNNTYFDSLVGGAAPSAQSFKLVNPLALYSYDFMGADSWSFSILPAPALRSAEAAGEMVEVYWHALLRDVPFNKYAETDTPTLVQQRAITGMNALSDFKGPKDSGLVTAQTLFRGTFAGETVGPYVSQFLYLPVPNGAGINTNGSGTVAPFNEPAYQELAVPQSGSTNNFMTDVAEWENIQRGRAPSGSISFDETRRWFIRNGRDLGEYVHNDYPGQGGLDAARILLSFGAAALDPANPYLTADMQNGFVTFGGGHILTAIMEVTDLALKGAWFQKWFVHRRLRPEFFGYLIENEGSNPSGLHADITGASVFSEPEFATNKLLPLAYPEGSPCHPSYPAGHATISGAVATVLKAFFNESYVIPNPVAPNSDNDALVAYTATSLTVGQELNKLASNIAIGRNIAGVHYRSDGTEGILLGEKIAIKYLENLALTYKESFAGFTLTKFDGTTVTVGAKS